VSDDVVHDANGYRIVRLPWVVADQAAENVDRQQERQDRTSRVQADPVERRTFRLN